MGEAADKTQKLLAALWTKNRPLIEQRLATLDEAAAAAAAGSLTEPVRKEAESCAHKLAGAVGMYGFDEGTRIARDLEVLFSGAQPDGARAEALSAELRRVLFPEG